MKYTADELEFMYAVDRFKTTSGQHFPTLSDILAIVKQLGYVRKEPDMAVQHGVVKGSNMPGPAGNLKNNGFLPLSGGGGSVTPPITGPGGDRRGGSFPLSASGAGITPPDHTFNVSNVGMPSVPVAVTPGKGAVPVQPTSSPSQSMPVSILPRGR